MSQQINLFNPAFRKQRTMLSFPRTLALFVLAVLVLGAVGAYRYQVVRGLEQEQASAQSTLAAMRTYADRVKADSAARKGDTAIDGEIARLETEVKAARTVMEALSGGALGERQGFAEYLRAFSRQSLEGLWLTGFSIGGGQIAIQGRTLQADLVPGYIQRLNREPVLKGRSFSALEMHQAKMEADATGRDAKDGKGAKDVRRTPPYLEFTMATGDAVPGAQAAAAGAVTAAAAEKRP